MRTWHTTRCEEQRPIPATRTKKIKWNLDDLCQRPGDEPGDEHFIMKHIQKSHSDSSSKGTRSSPATFFTLSSAASRSTLQRKARACPRSNNLIESSSRFCSLSSAE